MAFRILLVGLVAGMGCDPPSGGQVVGWMCSARSWFESADAGDPAPIPAVAKAESAAVPMLAIEPGPTYIPIFASEPIPTPAPSIERVAEAVPAVVAPDAPEPEPVLIADEGFAAVVGRMVSGYVVAEDPAPPAGLLAEQAARPAPPAPWVEMPEVEAFADANVVENGVEGASDWVGMPPTEPAIPAAAIAAEPERAQKLGSAVRLTGQALQAWMSLLLQ